MKSPIIDAIPKSDKLVEFLQVLPSLLLRQSDADECLVCPKINKQWNYSM